MPDMKEPISGRVELSGSWNRAGNPYTLRKYGACGSDLAQHGRDRIDQGAAICSRMASLQPGLG
jgi:hypothetical protein